MRARIAALLLASVAAITTIAGCSADASEDADDTSGAFSAANGRFAPKAEESGFSTINAAWLARASNAVYEAQERQTSLRPTLEAAIKSLGGDSIKIENYRFFDASGDTQAAYIATNRVRILAFRGTESQADVWRDLQFRQVDVSGGDVHRGFYGAFAGVWDGSTLLDRGQSLRAFLRDEAARSNVPLYVTGHSLGAALATLAVDAALRENVQVYALYTFGSPRVGNDVWADKMAKNANERNTKIFRVINYGDPVTVVPPTWLDYKHVSLMNEDENVNPRVVFMGKQYGAMFKGNTSNEHTFGERMSAYWTSVLSGEVQRHPIPYYMCKLDKVLDPNAPCPELVERQANAACVAMAEAYAEADSRSKILGGCGADEDDSKKAFVASLGCSNVVSVKNDAGLRGKCLPAIEKLKCDDLKGTAALSTKLPAECKEPFVRQNQPR